MLTSPQMDAALGADRPLLFGAFAIDLPGYDIRLLDGSAEVMIGADKYVGFDDRFGSIGAFEIGDDGTGDESPTMQLTFHPASGAAVSTLAAAEMQGSPVRFYVCALDRVTGLVIPDPLLWFEGELDVPRVRFGRTTVLEYDCVSGFERFHSFDEGMRLSDSFHKSVWPGEEGMAGMTGIVRTVAWGANPVTGTVAFGQTPSLPGGLPYMPRV